jgi:hypothetical protein
LSSFGKERIVPKASKETASLGGTSAMNVATSARQIDTTPVTLPVAAAIEAAEADAWEDAYAAAPEDWASEVGIESYRVGGALVISWAATGRRYFSRVIGLGVTEPVSEAAIDQILEGYEQAGISKFLLQSLPHCRPSRYEQWLGERGLEAFDQQDRIIRGGSPSASSPALGGGLTAERVTRDTAEEWAAFLQAVYRLDAGPWLPQLIGRPGWHQYVARRDGRIVAARGMYVGPGGAAWLGMDGPVPGVTTDDCEPDAALCAFMVADGVTLGARSFLADIEAPSRGFDTPAYAHFARLGFRRPYVRIHYTRL